MGRHRRSAPHALEAVRTGPVDGSAGAPAGRRGHRAAPRRSTPVRTGLLGASAAVAMGAVAVTSGLVPGGGRFEVSGGGRPDRIRADAPSDAEPQQSGAAAPAAGLPASTGRGSGGAETAPRDAGRTAPAPSSPSATPSASSSASPGAASPAPEGTDRPTVPPTNGPTTAAPRPSASPSVRPTAAGSTESAAEAEVVRLVNQERARAGCSPVTASDQLAGLAQRFSDDMARRGFFGHTDPDGHTPWDRARAQGIADVGGENIARGQADARSVMDVWMSSPEHRANILNCEYTTLGVGAHFGPGGPWWTQEFGF
ncbi:CAP domain-containing protein [Streptomyces sp. NPDC090442]|uniref:CAP domain-containing protein n=1 Tax=Streptomyces sp. NPDC090442 TaxID=3365962 RepID=UPI0038218724